MPADVQNESCRRSAGSRCRAEAVTVRQPGSRYPTVVGAVLYGYGPFYIFTLLTFALETLSWLIFNVWSSFILNGQLVFAKEQHLDCVVFQAEAERAREKRYSEMTGRKIFLRFLVSFIVVTVLAFAVLTFSIAFLPSAKAFHDKHTTSVPLVLCVIGLGKFIPYFYI